jgi:hypothetical protein
MLAGSARSTSFALDVFIDTGSVLQLGKSIVFRFHSDKDRRRFAVDLKKIKARLLRRMSCTWNKLEAEASRNRASKHPKVQTPVRLTGKRVTLRGSAAPPDRNLKADQIKGQSVGSCSKL